MDKWGKGTILRAQVIRVTGYGPNRYLLNKWMNNNELIFELSSHGGSVPSDELGQECPEIRGRVHVGDF